MKWYIYALFVGTNRTLYRGVNRVDIGRERGQEGDSRIERVAVDEAEPFPMKEASVCVQDI